MEFNHQLIDIEKGTQLDVRISTIDTFFLFSPIREFIVDPENATAVFERLMNLSFVDFWAAFKDQYPRYNLLSMHHPSVKKFETEQEAKDLFFALFEQLINRGRFSDDHSLVLGFPSFEHTSSNSSFTVCLGFTFKSMNSGNAIYFLNYPDSVRPL